MFSRLIPPGASYALAGFILLASPAVAATAADLPDGDAPLTLDKALVLALGGSPTLAAAHQEALASAAAIRPAGRLPNPELAISLENVAGSGAYRDSDAAEWTIELSQPLELGGKRRLRREAAELERLTAVSGEALVRADVLAATRQRYIAVLAAQDGLILTKEQAELAERSLLAADERIREGKAPTIDRLRLQGEASLARLAVAAAERSLATARSALAACWGEARLSFGRVAGDLAELPPLPEAAAIESALAQSPAATNRRLEAELAGNQLAQARAARIPDPSLTVGWRQFEESDEQAWLFGLSIPLPLFSHGQDELLAASHRLNGAQARGHDALLAAQLALQAAWQELADTRAEAELLAETVVPAAAEGHAAAEFGYRAGKFGLIELLDAQRTLFDAYQRRHAARVACHLAAAELGRLLGVAMTTPTP